MKKLSILTLLVALAACGGGHNGTLHISPPSPAHIITPQKPAGESGAIPNPPPEPPVVVPPTPSMELEPLMVDPDRGFNAISRIMGRFDNGVEVFPLSAIVTDLRFTKLDNGINANKGGFAASSSIPFYNYTNLTIRPDNYVLLTAEDLPGDEKNRIFILGGNKPITTYIDSNPIETKLSYMDWGVWRWDYQVQNSDSITPHAYSFVIEDTAPYCGGISCRITPEALPTGSYKFYGNTLAYISEYNGMTYNNFEKSGKAVLDFNPTAANKFANLTLNFDNWHTIQLNGISLNGGSGYSDMEPWEGRRFLGENPNPNFTISITEGGKAWNGVHYNLESYNEVNFNQKTMFYGQAGNPREAAGSYSLTLMGKYQNPDGVQFTVITGAFGAVRGN